MRRRRAKEEPEIFGMSLMDTVCCGIGASILMMLVFVTLVKPSTPVSSTCVNCIEKSDMATQVLPIFTLIVSVEFATTGVDAKRATNWAISSSTTTPDLVVSSMFLLDNLQSSARFMARYLPIRHRAPGSVLAYSQDTLTAKTGALPDGFVFSLDLATQLTPDVSAVYADIITHVNATRCKITPADKMEFWMKRSENSYQLVNCHRV